MANINRLLVTISIIFLVFIGYSQPYCDVAQGSAGFPSDFNCQTAICGADAYCCNVSWDGICASAAATNPNCTNCLSTAGCPVNAPVPDDACYQQVISADPFCCNTSWDALCQNAYDACNPASGPCTNINTIGGCNQLHSVSMSGTGDWNVNACGWNTPGLDVIYEFTPTTSGVHSIDITNISGGFINFFWKPASAGCDDTGWNCIQDIWTPGTYGSMSWTSGETYYILISPEVTSATDVTFQIDCPNPAPVNASDCEDAVSVCTDLNFTIEPSGYGDIYELCTNCTSNPSTNPASGNSGCLISGELNSTWMVINIQTTGNLEFEFGDAIGSNYYDWIMWPYDENACDDIIANNLAPVRCNWNGSGASHTGIADVPPGPAGNFEPSLPVTAGDQFVICFSNWSSAETDVPLLFGGSAEVNCIPLPVELLFFSGEPKNDYSLLNWETGAEINNSHFEIERSIDGDNFKNIGELKGQGTVTNTTSYLFKDKKPHQGINYYRLKQVDFDGKFEYSDVISVVHKGSKHFDILKLFPNPATQLVNMEITLKESSYLNFTITDQFGRQVISFDEMLSSGINLVEFDISKLSSGVYTVLVSSSDGIHRETSKLIVKKSK